MKKEYNIVTEYKGKLGDLIKDREYGKKEFRKQHKILTKEVSFERIIITSMLAYPALLTVLLVVGIVQKEVLNRGENIVSGDNIIELLLMMTVIVIIGVTIVSIKNGVIGRKYSEENIKLRKDVYFKVEEESNAETLESTIDENDEILELYKLVNLQQKEEVEVYKVEASIIPSENVPKGLTLQEGRLFKEGDTYYQIALKGKTFMKIYLEENQESMVIKGNNIKQTVNNE